MVTVLARGSCQGEDMARRVVSGVHHSLWLRAVSLQVCALSQAALEGTWPRQLDISNQAGKFSILCHWPEEEAGWWAAAALVSAPAQRTLGFSALG